MLSHGMWIRNADSDVSHIQIMPLIARTINIITYVATDGLPFNNTYSMILLCLKIEDSDPLNDAARCNQGSSQLGG